MNAAVGFLETYGANWATWWPQLLPAIWITVSLTVLSFVLAVVIGIVAALARLSHNGLLRAIATIYIEIARGVPTLAVLFLLYFGLTGVGIVLDAFPAGVIGLGLSGGGYFAEVFRTGIQAVHVGQREAAAAVGMTPFTTFRMIVLPQALRIVLPPMTNLFVGLLKDTSLCSLIAVQEVMLRSKDLAMTSFLPMHLFVLAAVIYFALAWPFSRLAKRLEKRLARGARAA